MDTAVALVQAYLHVNGYFTVVEYPVLEALRGDQVRTVTDLDVLAYRFPGAGHALVGRDGLRPLQDRRFTVDPVLGCPADRGDMIVGEVKEGTARLNPAMREPGVLEVALARFGCCPVQEAPGLAQRLLRSGHVQTLAGHEIRVVAFGDVRGGGRPGPWHTVPMAHVVQFLQQHLREHWAVLRHAQVRDPTFAVLALLQKWSGEPPAHRVDLGPG
jgi:hypothetical protein